MTAYPGSAQKAGGRAGGGVAGSDPAATATGAEVGGGDVGRAWEVALEVRLGRDTCRREGRVAASWMGVGRVDEVGMPAATEDPGLNETGVAVKRAPPKTGEGMTAGRAVDDVPTRLEAALP